MAPQTNEFGTKVGLLAGSGRPVRRPPDPRSCPARAAFGGRRHPPVREPPGARRQRPRRAGAGRLSGSGSSSLRRLRASGSGSSPPARRHAASSPPNVAELLDRRPPPHRPGARSPRSPSSQDVTDFDPTMAGPGAQEILVTLAENLELENQALLRTDASDPHRRRPRRPAHRDAGPAPGRAVATGTTVDRPLRHRRGRCRRSSRRSASRPASASAVDSTGHA